jgi:hypothetical protein
MFFLKKRGPPSKRRDFDKQKKSTVKKKGPDNSSAKKKGFFPKKWVLRQKEGILTKIDISSAKKKGFSNSPPKRRENGGCPDPNTGFCTAYLIDGFFEWRKIDDFGGFPPRKRRKIFDFLQ